MQTKVAFGISIDTRTKERLEACPLTDVLGRSGAVQLAIQELLGKWELQQEKKLGGKANERHR